MALFRPIALTLILGGAFALALAWPAASVVYAGDYDHDDDHVRQKLAAKFDVDESRITSLREEKLGYGEIDHTLTLASRLPGGITDENVDHVLELRQEQGMGWGQIAREMDTTLGAAKRDFRTAPPPSDDPGVQPTSVRRPGKSAHETARGAESSAGRHAAKGHAKGSRSAGRWTGTSAGRAHGHAFGGGASHGSSARAGGHGNGNGNGNGKGRK